jgi:hypothetical protein
MVRANNPLNGGCRVLVDSTTEVVLGQNLLWKGCQNVGNLEGHTGILESEITHYT